jgi:hypothetical protein
MNFYENYKKFRGRCRELSELAVKNDPTLRLVRGYYWCPVINDKEPHWWTVRPDGSIYDPSCLQFPSAGQGEYTEFDGWVECARCGKRILEEDIYDFVYKQPCCSYECALEYSGSN